MARDSGSAMARRLIDLSYPHLSYPHLSDPHLSDPHLGVGATRTTLTAPSVGSGLGAGLRVKLAEMPAVCIDVSVGRIARIDADGAIDLRRIGELDFEGVAVLIRTGFQEGAAAEDPQPHLTIAAAEALLSGGAGLIGIDTAALDKTVDPATPAHIRLLEAGVPVVTNLRGLDALRVAGFCFSAVLPSRVVSGPFTIRAFATIDDERYVG